MLLGRIKPLTPLTFRSPRKMGIGDVVNTSGIIPITTLWGVVRTAVGNALGVVWEEYISNYKSSSVGQILGDPREYFSDKMVVSYPMWYKDGELYIRNFHTMIVAKRKKENSDEEDDDYKVFVFNLENGVEEEFVINGKKRQLRIPALIDLPQQYEAVDGSVWMPFSEVLQIMKDSVGEWVDVDVLKLSHYVKSYVHTGIGIDRTSRTVAKTSDGSGLVYRLQYLEFEEIEMAFWLKMNDEEKEKELVGYQEVVHIGGKGGRALLTFEKWNENWDRSGKHVVLLSPLDQKTTMESLFEFASGATILMWNKITGFYKHEKDKRIRPTKLVLPPGAVFWFDEKGLNRTKEFLKNHTIYMTY